MKVVKTNQSTSRLTSTLDDLMEISVEGPSSKNFNADCAVQLRWLEFTMQTTHSECSKGVQTKSHQTEPSESSSCELEQEEFALD